MDTSPPQDNRIDLLHPTQNTRLIHRLLRLFSQPKHIPQVIKHRVFGKPKVIEWDSRADELGAYSVIDTRHSPDEYEYVTKRQKEILYPLFKQQLKGHEQTILDFGCGPGRFTGDLADLTNAKAIGTDITARLIELAPPHPNVEYIHSKTFFDDHCLAFDVIWISLTLGGIPDNELPAITKRIANALIGDGLLFLVESTSETPVEGIWRIRTREQLMSLFPTVRLRHIGSYYDVNQEISVIAGRKAST